MFCECEKPSGGMLEFVLKESGIFHVGCGKEIKLPIVTDKKEWPCEHITHGQDGDKSKWYLEGYCLIPGSWATCPIVHCGATRPKEPNERQILENMILTILKNRMDISYAEAIRWRDTILEKFTLRKPKP